MRQIIYLVDRNEVEALVLDMEVYNLSHFIFGGIFMKRLFLFTAFSQLGSIVVDIYLKSYWIIFLNLFVLLLCFLDIKEDD